MAIAVDPAMEVMPKKKSPTKQRRVVVTGMGVETPLGHDPDVFYNNLLEGVSGISEIEGFDCSQFPTVCLACYLSLYHSLGSVLVIFTIKGFHFRELLERSNHSQLKAGLHLSCPREWTTSCFTC